MGRIVVLGEPVAVEGFALAGATVVLAENADAVRRAWAALPPDVTIVVLTPSASDVLGKDVLGKAVCAERDGLLTIEMPR